MSSHSHTSTPARPEALRAAFHKASLGLLFVGLAGSVYALATDPKRFGFSYLVSFVFLTTLGCGGLGFVILQHVSRAGWSVAPRRQAEWLAGVLPLAIVLFIPIAALAGNIFDVWVHPHGEHMALIEKKRPYLNTGFFYLRAAICLLVWSGLSWYFRKTSRQQDESGDVALTARMQKWSAPSILLLGLTISFAGFDWVMSLQPEWYSTIFGIYMIAGSLVSAMAVLAIVVTLLRDHGAFGEVCTQEHMHDIGKLLFAFTVFWAYIAFSQFILIWYANIPEETVFFKHRFEGSWASGSVFLLFGHFVLPFVVLLSRHGKRNRAVLLGAAVWMLLMHYWDIYWNVMPNLDTAGIKPSVVDAATLCFMVGVLGQWFARRMAADNSYPVRDPRVAEAVRNVNL